MDICSETLIGFVCAHCDAFEFLKLAEEILDQVAVYNAFERGAYQFVNAER